MGCRERKIGSLGSPRLSEIRPLLFEVLTSRASKCRSLRVLHQSAGCVSEGPSQQLIGDAIGQSGLRRNGLPVRGITGITPHPCA